MKYSVNFPCPCGSRYKYKKCCYPFHKGKVATDALLLMRSRYSAFVVCDAQYIIKTTDQDNAEYIEDRKKWKKEIESFSNSCEFKNLEILEFVDGEQRAFVTFNATIFSNGEDCSFVEKSEFIKKNEKWLYFGGIFL